MSAAAVEPITSRSIWMTSPQSEPGESLALVLLRRIDDRLNLHIEQGAERDRETTATLSAVLTRLDGANARLDKLNGTTAQNTADIRALQGEDRYEEGRAAGVMQEHERVTGQVGKIWTIGTDLFRVDIAIVLALGMVTGWLVDWIR